MNPEQTKVMQQCAKGALSGEFTFPDICGRLAAIGVERYHADYSLTTAARKSRTTSLTAILSLSERPIPLMQRPTNSLHQPLQPQFGKVSEMSTRTWILSARRWPQVAWVILCRSWAAA